MPGLIMRTMFKLNGFVFGQGTLLWDWCQFLGFVSGLWNPGYPDDIENNAGFIIDLFG
jgi:hypothetical protein